ncbi:MAG: hypothetical protein EBQ95_02060 [Gammaproteobacteria bacterium]|nr:hypothetical protein [Gammaproteobacteria bacterium]
MFLDDEIFMTVLMPPMRWSLMRSQKLENVLAYLPGLWMGSIVLGTSIEAICFFLALISIAFQPNAWVRIRNYYPHIWFWSLLSIALWMTISLFWTPLWDHEAWFNLKKVYRLLLLPVMMLGFDSDEKRMRALHAFVIMMLIPAMICVLNFFHVIQFRDEDPGHIFYNHILTGFQLCMAAYLSMVMFHQRHLKNDPKAYIYLAVGIALSLVVTCANSGKMAYVLYFVLMGHAFFYMSGKHSRWFLFGGMMVIVMGMFFMSPMVHTGIESLYKNVHQFEQGEKATTLGFRIQFHHFAYTLFKKHWFAGGGAGSYVHWFKILNPVPEWDRPPNSHSQYWLVASEHGLIGLMLWALFLGYLALMSVHVPFYGQIWRGFMLAVLINSFTDNVLNYCIGYMFLGITAMMLVAAHQTKD